MRLGICYTSHCVLMHETLEASTGIVLSSLLSLYNNNLQVIAGAVGPSLYSCVGPCTNILTVKCCTYNNSFTNVPSLYPDLLIELPLTATASSTLPYLHPPSYHLETSVLLRSSPALYDSLCELYVQQHLSLQSSAALSC